MTDDEIFSAIEEQRAKNNKIFMRVWRRIFELDRPFAKQAQAELRDGDLRISELNAKLISKSCECGFTRDGFCPSCRSMAT